MVRRSQECDAEAHVAGKKDRQNTVTSTDVIWSEFKTYCNQLRHAKNLKDRNKAFNQLQVFMSSENHRYYVQKWRGWSLLISSVLFTVKEDAKDVFKDLDNSLMKNVGSIAIGKRKAGKIAKISKKNAFSIPKMTYWNYLCTLLGDANVAEGPILHLDANGRDVIKELFVFSGSILECGVRLMTTTLQNEDIVECNTIQQKKKVVTVLTATCWQILKSVSDHRVYCNVLAPSQVDSVFKIAFKTLEFTDKNMFTSREPHGRPPCSIQSSFFLSASQQTNVALIMKKLYKGRCFGIGGQDAVSHVRFFETWFASLQYNNIGSVEILAVTMLQAVTKLLERHWDYGLAMMMISSPGMNIIHFIQRAWKDTSFRLRGAYLDYLLLFCEALKQYRNGLLPFLAEIGSNEIDDSSLFREMNTLLSIFLHPKQLNQYLQGVDVISRALNLVCGEQETSSISRTENITSGELCINSLALQVEKQSCKFYQCTAELCFQHDGLLQRVQSTFEMNGPHAKLDQSAAATGSDNSLPAAAIGNYPLTSARDLLRTKLQTLFDVKIFIPHAELSGEHVTDNVLPRHPRLKSAGSYIFLLSSIVCRYGDASDCYLDGNIFFEVLLQCLDSKTIDVLQFLALLTLLKALGYLKYRSKIDEGMRLRLWETLLRSDLPYAATTDSSMIKNSAGSIVMQLTYACFTLLSPEFITREQNRLWKLPLFALHTKAAMNSNKNRRVQVKGVGGSARKESRLQLSVSPLVFISQFIVQFELYEVEKETECGQAPFTFRNIGICPQTTREKLLATILFLLDFKSMYGLDFDRQDTTSSDVFIIQSAVSLIVLLGRAFSRQIIHTSPLMKNFMIPTFLSTMSQSFSDKRKKKTRCSNSVEWTSFGIFVTSEEEEVSRMIHQATWPLSFQEAHAQDAPLSVIIYREQMRSFDTNGIEGDQLTAYPESNRDTFAPIHPPPWLLDNQHIPNCIDVEARNKDSKSTKFTNFVSDSDIQTLFTDVVAWIGNRIDVVKSTLDCLQPEDPASLAQINTTLDMAYVVFVLTNVDSVPAVSMKEQLRQLQQKIVASIIQNIQPDILLELLTLNNTAALTVQLLFRRLETFFLITKGPNALNTQANVAQSSIRLLATQLAMQVGALLESLVTSKKKITKSPTEFCGVSKPQISFGWPSQESPSVNRRKSPVSKSFSDTHTSLINDVPGECYLASEKEADFLDESAETRGGVKQSFIRHDIHVNVRMWALRLLTNLDISSAINIIQDVAQELQLTPEALIALASFLYRSHPTEQNPESHFLECSESVKRLALFLRLLDCAMEDIEKEAASTRLDVKEFFAKDVTIEKKAGDRVFAFYYQAFVALKACLSTFEKQKKSLLHLTTQSILPVDLTNMITKMLECTAQVGSETRYWTLEVIQLQVFEISFRLDPEYAAEFPDHCMQHLLHSVPFVRIIAARCLQSVFYMYPSGGAQIFSTLLQVLDEEYFSSKQSAQTTDESKHDLPWNSRVMWHLLYVCGSSDINVLPSALAVFLWSLRHLSHRFEPGNIYSAAHEWLRSIGNFYGYPSAQDMMNSHMLQVWMQWCLKLGVDGSTERPFSILEALEAFPVYILSPLSVRTSSEHASIPCIAPRFFLRHISVILPVAILVQARVAHTQGTRIHFKSIQEVYSYLVDDDHNAMKNIGIHCISDSIALAAVLSTFGDRLDNAGQRKHVADLAAVIINAIKDENTLNDEFSSDQLTCIVAKITQLAMSVYLPESWISSGEESTYSTVLIAMVSGHDDRKFWKAALLKLEEEFLRVPTQMIEKPLDRVNLPQIYACVWLLLLTTSCDSHSTRAEPTVDCLECLIDQTKSFWTEQEALSRFIMHILFTTTHHLLSTLSTTTKHFVKSSHEYTKALDRAPVEATSIIDSAEQLTRILCTLSEILAQEPASTHALGRRLTWMTEHVCRMMQVANDSKYLDKIKANLEALTLLLVQVAEISDKTWLNSDSIRSGLSPRLDALKVLFEKAKVKNDQRHGMRWGEPPTNHLYQSRPGLFATQNEDDELLRNIQDAKTLLHSNLGRSSENIDDITSITSRLLRSLLHEYTSHADQDDIISTHLRCIQAQTLGELGALDPYVFSLTPDYGQEERVQSWKGMVRQTAYNGSANHGSNMPLSMHEVMISELVRILFHPHSSSQWISPFHTARVLRKVLSTLCRLVSSDCANQAFMNWNCKEPGLKCFVEQLASVTLINWDQECLFFEHRTGPVHFIWSLPGKSGFDSWITHTTTSILKVSASLDEKLSSLACDVSIIALQPGLACQLFPHILYIIFQKYSKDNQIFKDIVDGLESICSSHRIQDIESYPSADRYAVQFLMHSLNFVREREKREFMEMVNVRPGRPSYILRGILAPIDLLTVAEATIHVKMPCSAMQYVEMWMERTYGELVNLGRVTPETPGKKNLDRARNILLEAYQFDATNADAMDGFNEKLSTSQRILSHTHGKDYAKALPLLDAIVQCSHFSGSGQLNNNIESLLYCLRRLGYEHLLGACVNLTSRSTADRSENGIKLQVQEYEYEKRWHQLEWDKKSDLAALMSWHDQEDDKEKVRYRHHCTLFHALRALVKNDTEQTLGIIQESQLAILKLVQFAVCGQEQVADSHKALLHLQHLKEVYDATKLLCRTDKEKSSAHSWEILLHQWFKRHDRIRGDFDSLESILRLEETLLKLLIQREWIAIDKQESNARYLEQQTSDWSSNALAKIYLLLACSSRKSKRIATATKALLFLQEMDESRRLSFEHMIQWRLEKSKLSWAQRDHRSAIQTAQVVLHQIDASSEPRHTLLVNVLTTLGSWLASQRSINSHVIINEYFLRATKIADCALTESGSFRVLVKAYRALGNYMADMYQQVQTRVSSNEWLAGKRVAEARQRELRACLDMEESKQKESRAHIHTLTKEIEFDHKERAKVESSVDNFLIGALQNYSKALQHTYIKGELAMIFRLVSLWFSNNHKSAVNETIHLVAESIPSYKFVPLSYQIISRIGSEPNGIGTKSQEFTFERVLNELVMKLAEQHPHHVLIHLIALRNSADVEGRGAAEFRVNAGDAKAQVAEEYMNKLYATKQGDLLRGLHLVSQAYGTLALFDTREEQKKSRKISLSKVKSQVPTQSRPHGKLVLFDHCTRYFLQKNQNVHNMPAVLTDSIEPRADMDYSDIARIRSFDPNFTVTETGIHRPKIIYCFGSDGRRYKQLVKGMDDTRQDLVIEQMFVTMNTFLQEDPATRKRKLRIRTYKVVPLSPISGVLEWVDSTLPWGSYLVGRTGKKNSAHERYHPHEWKHMECRNHLQNSVDKLAAYQEIEANFTPVFHHFFLETYPDPAIWYQCRLAYTKSVAVNSIVGYVVGIGDRHSQNILIHKDSAELVHIDFGVVFDQGLALLTPETIPFRLTRDIVDGMGATGCDGVFTHCAQETMRLLRNKSSSVITILEVFVYDPLYRWTISPLKALQLQCNRPMISERPKSSSVHHTKQDAKRNHNDAAARALIRVKQKLEGYEDPNGNALSVEGQVKYLVQQAQDPQNLSCLFPGWAPWM